MKIVEDYSGNYIDDIVTHFGLSSELINDENTVLFNGFQSCINEKLKSENSDYNNRVYINTEFPCSLLINEYDIVKKLSFFTKVLSICPYTNNWLNSNNETNTKYINIPFPYNSVLFEKYNNIGENDKIFDVIYYGQYHSNQYYDMINTISKFNYKYLTPSTHGLTPELKSKITDFNVSTMKKWDILSNTKISVGINLLFINESHKSGIRKYPEWDKNVAFSRINENIMPQLKTRMIEAALCKTIMLIKRDHWNVIEYWFKPDVDFIYWDNKDDLNEKISEISKNYGKYQHIINNAHNKAQQYSIKNILKENT